MIGGHFIMAVAHFAVGYFNDVGNNNGVLICIMTFLFVYQNTSGPIAWMYAAETTADVAMGTILLILWFTVFILEIICPKLMEPSSLGPSAVFYMFSGISVVATLYCCVFIKETFGMTDK